jgi:hypothetical protein
MYYGDFINRENIHKITTHGRVVLSIGSMSIGIFKQQIFEVCQEYLCLTAKKMDKDVRAGKVRRLTLMMNTYRGNSVIDLLQRIFVQMQDDLVQRTTRYSDSSLCVLISNYFVEYHNLFQLSSSVNSPDERCKMLLQKLNQIRDYVKLGREVHSIISNAQRCYERWYQEMSSNSFRFKYLNLSHGALGQYTALNFSVEVRRLADSHDMIGILRLLYDRLTSARFKNHSYNTFLVKYLYYGELAKEVMFTDAIDKNEVIRKFILNWIDEIFTDLALPQDT